MILYFIVLNSNVRDGCQTFYLVQLYYYGCQYLLNNIKSYSLQALYLTINLKFFKTCIMWRTTCNTIFYVKLIPVPFWKTSFSCFRQNLYSKRYPVLEIGQCLMSCSINCITFNTSFFWKMYFFVCSTYTSKYDSSASTQISNIIASISNRRQTISHGMQQRATV